MKKELLQQYTTRVTQANRTQLVVTVYDIILTSLEDAKEAYQSGVKDEWRHSLERAQRLVMELLQALDFRFALSKELGSLYLYVNRRILHALVQNKVELLEGTDTVIRNLRNAFEEVSRTDDSAPVMVNTQKVYAGLTYGKSSALSEMFQDDNNRGFQA